MHIINYRNVIFIKFLSLLSGLDFEGYMPLTMNMKTEVMRLLFSLGSSFVIMSLKQQLILTEHGLKDLFVIWMYDAGF